MGLDFSGSDERRINSPIQATVAQIKSGILDLPLAPGKGWLIIPEKTSGFDPASWRQGSQVLIDIRIRGANGPVAAAVSAGPILAQDGKMVFDPLDSEFAALEGNSPRARSAVGLSQDGKKIILMTIDGSLYGPSRGATLRGLCGEMLAMGASDILNLDGGSSTTAWALGRLVNRPGGLIGSRPVSNALFVFGKTDPDRSDDSR